MRWVTTRTTRRSYSAFLLFVLVVYLIVSVAMSLIIFWLFELQFSVPLPKGPLEQWFGY